MDLALKKQRLVVLDIDDCLAQMFADEGPVLRAIINDFYKPRLTKQEFETLKQRVSVEKEPLCYDYRSYYNQIVGKDFSVEDLKQWHAKNTELLLRLPAFKGVDQGFESVVVLEDFPTVITQYLQALPGFANLKMFIVKHAWNASTVFDENLPESLLSEKQAFLSFIKQYLYNSSRDDSSSKASLAYVHVQELRDLLLHL
ncbi:hypothetical protein J7L02_02980 [Candidatus Woesearchaeota archaeon]|nr:hypothetical protein [Candidatus Woesearchaeota archaeon]